MSRFLPYGTQSIGPDDIRAVVRVLRSDRLTQGPEVERFEEDFAKYVGAPYAVAVNSGTAGLHLAAMAAGWTAGDEVITTPMTFVASANCALYVGAKPVFADIRQDTRCIDPEQVDRRSGRRTRGLIPVHFAGVPCQGLRRTSGVVVVEDACHALGAQVRRGDRWSRIGACEDTDMAVFSFHPVKHITTGEGGMITTRSRDLYKKLRLLRTHGITREPNQLIRPKAAAQPWYYEMRTLGFNYRITDIQCALGASQLRRSDRFLWARRRWAAYYGTKLRDIEHLELPYEPADVRSSWHLFAVRIDFAALGLTRANVMERLRSDGVGSQVHYIPVHLQPYYAERYGYRRGAYPVSERYYDQALSLPLFPSMSKSDAARVVKALSRALRRRVR